MDNVKSTTQEATKAQDAQLDWSSVYPDFNQKITKQQHVATDLNGDKFFTLIPRVTISRPIYFDEDDHSRGAYRQITIDTDEGNPEQYLLPTDKDGNRLTVDSKQGFRHTLWTMIQGISLFLVLILILGLISPTLGLTIGTLLAGIATPTLSVGIASEFVHWLGFGIAIGFGMMFFKRFL